MWRCRILDCLTPGIQSGAVYIINKEGKYALIGEYSDPALIPPTTIAVVFH